MKHRLRSTGMLGAALAVVVPQLAITTAAVVLTPTVAEAQVGRVHRATRRRTAVVVHTHDQNQAAQQQQQQQQQQAPPPPPPDGQQQSSASADSNLKVAATDPTVDGSVLAIGVARPPPDAVQPSAGGGWQRDG